MINEIRKRAENGETIKLECINEYGFLNNNKGSLADKMEILSSSLVVDRVDGVRDHRRVLIMNCDYHLREECLEYFKIKEAELTFDDLIDIAVQAVRDNLLIITNLEHDSISIRSVDERGEDFDGRVFSRSDYESAINWGINYIKSLYTETFVIKNENDIKRIRKQAKLTLANYIMITAESGCLYYGDMPHIKSTYGSMSYTLNFVVLKGATVTQKRKI